MHFSEKSMAIIFIDSIKKLKLSDPTLKSKHIRPATISRNRSQLSATIDGDSTAEKDKDKISSNDRVSNYLNVMTLLSAVV